MYDDNIFADRFRNQLTMFEMRVTIGLSRLLDNHIVHVIVISQITTVNLHDDVVFADRFRYQLLCLK